MEDDDGPGGGDVDATLSDAQRRAAVGDDVTGAGSGGGATGNGDPLRKMRVVGKALVLITPLTPRAEAPTGDGTTIEEVHGDDV